MAIGIRRSFLFRNGTLSHGDLLSSLGLDEAEWLQDIHNGDCSLKGFLSIVGDSINEREIRKFEELNSEVKLSLYKTLLFIRCVFVC